MMTPATTDNIAEQTANLTKWQAAHAKLRYLSILGYRHGDVEFDTAFESVRVLQRELRELQR